MDRDTLPSGGFVAPVDALVRGAEHLHAAADNARAPGRRELDGSRRRSDWTAPAWLSAAEHGWAARGAQLVAALHRSGTALAGSAATYTAADARIAEVLRDIARGCGDAARDDGAFRVRQAAARHGPDSAHRRVDSTATWPAPAQPDTAARPGGTGIGAEIHEHTSRDDAVAVWTARDAAAARVEFALASPAVVLPDWLGPAATSYLEWLRDHSASWAELRQKAAAVREALVSDGRSSDTRKAATSTAAASAASTTHAAETDDHADTHPHGSTDSTGSTVVGDANGAASTTPVRPTGRESAHDHSATSNAPSETPASRPDSAGLPDHNALTAVGVENGDRQQADPISDTAQIALLGIGATATAATAAALILADSDYHPHYDINPRDLTARPTPRAVPVPHGVAAPPSPAWPPPVHHEGEPLAVAHGLPSTSTSSTFTTAPPPAAAPQPLWPVLPDFPPAPDPEAGSAACPCGPANRRTSDAPGSATAAWMAIGDRHDRPVLLDLARTSGLGLSGPGAAAVARTILLRVTTTTVVITRDLATLLLGAPATATGAVQPNSSPPAGRGVPRSWWIMPDPLTALRLTETEIARRDTSTSGHPATRPRLGPGSPADHWVLVVPAPIRTDSQELLHRALALGRHLGVTAVLLGPWRLGWNLSVDDQHHVTSHTPARHTPTDQVPLRPQLLTGAQLAPTTADDLRTALHADSDTATFVNTITAALTDPRQSHPHTRSAEPSDAGPTTEPDTAPTVVPDDTAHQPDDPPAQPRSPLHLTVLGHTTLLYRDTDPLPRGEHTATHTTTHTAATAHRSDQEPHRYEAIHGLGPRATGLLTYLAAHPDGVPRHTLVAALWPDTHTDRPTNALNSTLTRLRRTLHRVTGNHDLTQLVSRSDDRYHLHPELVTVDYWDFLVAAAHLHDPDPDRRAHAAGTAIALYQGPLGAEHDGEWLLTLREATRRRYLEALTTLARHTITDDPLRTLGLLETARNLDPHNEAIYRDIMRIQHRLGRHDAVTNTLTLLRAQLADIDTTPEPQTVNLARQLKAA